MNAYNARTVFLTGLAAFLLLAALMPASVMAQEKTDHLKPEASSAVILAYYRIGEDGYPASNLRLAQFRAHLEEIRVGGYNVVPLAEIIEAIRNDQPLPDRTIAITFEGGYKSVLTEAAPLLFKAGLPFTVLVTSTHADSNSEQFLNWRDLKNLQKNTLVTIGITPAQYDRVDMKTAEENKAGLFKAMNDYREHFGISPDIFAYPYGAYTEDYRVMIEDQSFKGALALNSSPVYSDSDPFALPRFTMTELYGDLQRFQVVVNSKAMPATDIEPETSVIDGEAVQAGFTLTEQYEDLHGLIRCYASDQGRIEPDILAGRRFEIRLPITEDERLRVNCTAPAGEDGRYYWLGFLFYGESTLSDNFEGPPVEEDEPGGEDLPINTPSSRQQDEPLPPQE